MKYVVLVLLVNVVKCESTCYLDNKAFTLDGFLYYHEIKRKVVRNNPKLYCCIENICNTRFSKNEKHFEEYSFCEENVHYDLYNFTEEEFVLSLDYYFVYDLEWDLELDYEECSFCELYFMFEHKTKFVFLIGHLEIWLFSHRNVTIHSNQLINKSGYSFFNRR